MNRRIELPNAIGGVDPTHAGAPEPSAPPAQLDKGQSLVVSPGGDGQYHSINEAITQAPPGTRIVVRPGQYTESLVIDKPIEIVGDGPRDQIVVQHNNAMCISVRAEGVIVRGLTVRRGDENDEEPAIDMTQGALQIEDCIIACEPTVTHAIRMQGSQTSASLRRCTIEGTIRSIVVSDNAEAVIQDCDIFGYDDFRILVERGACLMVQRSRIHSSTTYGDCLVGNVHVQDADAVVEDSEIFSDKAQMSGIVVNGGSCIIQRCTLHHNATGITVRKGEVTAEHCQIIENSTGVIAWSGSSITLRGCKVSQNTTIGVSVGGGATLSAHNCDMRGNTEGSWDWDIAAKTGVERSGNLEDQGTAG
jgi:nitrous oxidase accessory protein NosD